VFKDGNADLYLCSVLNPTPTKLAASVQSYAWNSDIDILAAISDNSVTVWYYPAACLFQKDLVDLTKQTKTLSIGENASIKSFTGYLLSVRQGNGVCKTVTTIPYVRKVYDLATKSKCVSVTTKIVVGNL
jgi:hypothetical protein